MKADSENYYTIFRRSLNKRKIKDEPDAYTWTAESFFSDAKSCLKGLGRFYKEDTPVSAIMALKSIIKEDNEMFEI